MGSKRVKKSKPEGEILTEDAIKNVQVSNENISESTIAAAPKRKKKTDNEAGVPPKVKKVNSDTDGKKVKIKKQKVENEITVNGISDVNGNDENKNFERKKVLITWPDLDINELINRMENNLPESDSLAYKSRVEKLNWNEIAFKNYTPNDCKKTWLQVQKRIRRFRLLKELLVDAKDWMNRPKNTSTRNNKLVRSKKHPDMPRRPISSYLLFYLEKKNDILIENPGLDASDISKKAGEIFKNLSPIEKEKYDKQAATNREEYLQNMKIFLENHPECVKPPRISNQKEKIEPTPAPPPPPPPPTTTTITEKVKKKVTREKKVKVAKVSLPKGRPVKVPRRDRPPKKWQTPFALYFASELKNMEPGTEKPAFREKCKQIYRTMNDEQKVQWINLAEQDLIRFDNEVKAYKLKFPNFKTKKVTCVLTKRERASKERAAGKPVKPPNSAYAWYSKILLQSDEIKSIQSRDRMNHISTKWKNCTAEEQESYKEQAMEKYRKDFKEYVEGLPEEERKKYERVRKKRTRNGRVAKSRARTKRRRPVKKQPPKAKFLEPEQPPISACKYFVSLYKGEGEPIQAWKALSYDEKRKYEEELVKKKQAYIVEFEKFLKSLSKDELEAFSKSRQQQVQSDEGESSGCSSGEDENEEDDGDDEDEAASDSNSE